MKDSSARCAALTWNHLNSPEPWWSLPNDRAPPAGYLRVAKRRTQNPVGTRRGLARIPCGLKDALREIVYFSWTRQRTGWSPLGTCQNPDPLHIKEDNRLMKENDNFLFSRTDSRVSAGK